MVPKLSLVGSKMNSVDVKTGITGLVLYFLKKNNQKAGI